MGSTRCVSLCERGSAGLAVSLWGFGEERKCGMDGWLSDGLDDNGTTRDLSLLFLSLSAHTPDSYTTLADCTRRDASSATSALSATLAPTPPSSRSRVLPRRRTRNSTLARCVGTVNYLWHDTKLGYTACCIRLPGEEEDRRLQRSCHLGVSSL